LRDVGTRIDLVADLDRPTYDLTRDRRIIRLEQHAAADPEGATQINVCTDRDPFLGQRQREVDVVYGRGRLKRHESETTTDDEFIGEAERHFGTQTQSTGTSGDAKSLRLHRDWYNEQ